MLVLGYCQMNEAAMAALEEKLTSSKNLSDLTPTPFMIKLTHFKRALSKISPSVSDVVSLHSLTCNYITTFFLPAFKTHFAIWDAANTAVQDFIGDIQSSVR